MKIDANQLGGSPREPSVTKPGSGAAGLQEGGAADGTRRAARLGYQDASAKTADAPQASPTDEVSLSGLSQELSRLTSADPKHEARIDRLAADFAAGKLEIDAGRVASKLVDDALLND